MSAPSQQWICEQQADALDALASFYRYAGFPELAERFEAAAKVLREEPAGGSE